MTASQTPTGRSRSGSSETRASAPASSARTDSVRSIVRLRSHRSTQTPAIGPTTTTAMVAAISKPPIAAGAHGFPEPIFTAIHSVSVVLNT
jgi:hypothetical protein